jgi:hypothetical protein
MPCAQRQASRSGTERRQRQAEQHATQRQLSADEATHAQDPDERAHGDRVDVIAIMDSLKWWQSVLLNLQV